jgi:riboflavin synthase
MFTGIILAVGKISAIQNCGGDYRFKINTGQLSLTDTVLGDSIAVNGVCLTAIEVGYNYFCADVSNETLSRSTLNDAQINMPVNLELALMPSSRLGGHIVSGHVDGIATITEKKIDARSIQFQLNAPNSLAKYIAEKGSICIDGISLTVNQVQGANFSVNIVPHTLEKTTLYQANVGTKVNLEVDLLARYLERLIQADNVVQSHPNDSIDMDLLRQSGFIA